MDRAAAARVLGGLAAVVFLHVHCSASSLVHLKVTHVLPLVAAVVISAFAGRRLLAV